MATQVLKNVGIWMDKYDVAGDTNAASLDFGAPEVDKTTFNDTFRTIDFGIVTITFTAEGFFNAATGELEDDLLTNLALAGKPYTIAPTSTVGDVAYLFPALQSNYNFGGQVGEMLKFSIDATGSGAGARGTLEFKSTDTTDGSSTGSQLGAVTASQNLYATLHVTAASGTTPTLDVDVESDDNGSFTSSTVQGSFTQATTTTSELITIAGAITDDYWRINYTIGGTSPSFTFTVALGINV